MWIKQGLKLIITLLALIQSQICFSQDTIPSLQDSTLEGESIYTGFGENLDSLLNLWYVQQSVDTNSMITGIENDSSAVNLEFPDSIYQKRLSSISSFIDLPFNRIVKNFISVYTQKKRDKVEVMIGLTDYYFPIFEEVLDLYQLPQELRFLPMIESALNPKAVSRVGATGLWQFMYGTGRMYKLTINTYIDERRDPIASSHAAARYLRDLYSIYKDWTLVIAAYNCGPGNVNKAIRRAHGKRDYWEIYYYLPRETRGYVPAFIAATYTFYYYRDHKITPQPINYPQTSDTLMIKGMLHLQQVSEVLNVPISLLRDLNPQYKQDIIPAREKQLPIKLPLDLVGQFIDREKEIFAYKDSVFFNPKNAIAPSRYTSSYQHDVPPGSVRYIYKVQEGDVLGKIAERYNVSVTQLRSWNNIRRNIIRIGQRLIIYVPERTAQKLGIKKSTKTSENLLPDFIYHRVKNGENLWNIAQLYPGVTSSEIKKINNLKSDRVFPGQTLKIKPKG